MTLIDLIEPWAAKNLPAGYSCKIMPGSWRLGGDHQVIVFYKGNNWSASLDVEWFIWGPACLSGRGGNPLNGRDSDGNPKPLNPPDPNFLNILLRLITRFDVKV
jgi:hypothetical protein